MTNFRDTRILRFDLKNPRTPDQPKIADHGDLKIVIRQMMRLHRNDLGKVVRADDHGPDALMCAMLHFRFEDEFESAIDQLYADGQQERRRLTNAVLEACIRDQGQTKSGRGSSMGVSVGAADYYVVISAMPADVGGVRRALYVGRAQSFEELGGLRAKYEVRMCVVDAQADPHRVDEWARRRATGAVVRAEYLNDGVSRPEWDYAKATVSVDRTYLLDAAHDEIRAGTWWLMSGAQEVDDGEFFAQMKAPKRERDLTAGVLRYRWTESGGVEHYRHAQAFDHLAAGQWMRNRMRLSSF